MCTMSVARNGLANLGNTCYINSVLQCLRYSPLTDLIEKHNDKRPSLVRALSQLFETSQEHNDVCVRPISVVNTIISDPTNEFVENMPGDAHELLSYLITTLHDQMSKKVKITISGSPMQEADRLHIRAMESFKQFFEKEYSSLLRVFYGQVTNCIESCETPFRTCVFEPFIGLHVPIPKDIPRVNLYDCLDAYFESERLQGDSSFHDDVADRYVTAIKRHYLWSCPDVLAVTLMRFRLSTSFKNTKIVLIPEILNLSKYMHPAAERTDVMLRLFATCNHIGSDKRGHYIALCKDGNGWVKYDDDLVLEQRSFESNESSYVLFYKK